MQKSPCVHRMWPCVNAIFVVDLFAELSQMAVQCTWMVTEPQHLLKDKAIADVDSNITGMEESMTTCQKGQTCL